jgi:hypothetical protein
MSQNIPMGPLIPSSDNVHDLSVMTLKSDTVVSGSVSSETGSLGFFKSDPVSKQQGASTQNDSGFVTQDSDHNSIVDLINIFNNYGLANHSNIFKGRTITFINNTSNPTIELYVTVGGTGNTLTKIHSFTGTGTAYSYAIPDIIGWSGNFQCWPVGQLPVDQLGANLFEISANDQTKTAVVLNPLRDNWDISTVSPQIPDPQLDCGPRAQTVASSYMKITGYGSGYFPGFNLSTVNQGSGLVTGGTIVSSGTSYPIGATGVSGGSGTGLLLFVQTTTTGPPGPVATFSVLQAGTGYQNGELVTLTDGTGDATITLTVDTGTTGSGLKVDLISVNGGSLTYPICDPSWVPSTPGIGGFTIRDFGSGYSASERLLVVQNTAIQQAVTGSGYSVASGVATTGGTGIGLTVDILEVNQGTPIKVGIANNGSGYLVGDTITVAGGNADATYNVLSVTPATGGTFTIGPLTRKQCNAYNVGYQVTPPAPPSDTVTYPPLQPISGGFWPPVVTTCINTDGNCSQAITWPNDTVLPKSQTGYAQGNYTVTLLDPIVNFP